MTRHHIHVTSQSIVNGILHHILASTSFTDAIIDSLHKFSNPIIISGKGFHKSWPKALRYGTHDMYSLQLTHLGVVKMLKKIDILQKFLSHRDYSNVIIVLIDNYQLTSGITIPILVD